ncbi:MAG: type II secretion system F family protein [Thermodesulfovibrio sp.]|nr:type II secretion system F family protein [Thermodesulfovibrio sp.]
MLKEYACTYLEPSGSERKTVVVANDTKEVIQRLKEQGFVVVDVKEKITKKHGYILRKGITISDLYNIANQLSILLRSGMKIDNALNLLISSSRKEKLKEVLKAVNQEIKSGKPVTQALEERKLFPPLFISMVHVGESIGNLSTAFENVANYLKFQIELRREIINSLTYPFFLILASIVTLFFMFNFIIPRFFAIFETTGKMPLPAKFIFAVVSIFNIKNFFIFLILILLLYIFKKYGIINIQFKGLSSYANRIPIIKSLLFNLELSRFSYSMYSMLRSGVDFVKSVKLSAEIIQDSRLRDALSGSINEIKKGKRIADVFSQIAILPDVIPNLLRVGEESGNLQTIFLELYQIFNDRFKNTIRRFLVLLEPTIIVFMGLIVGFIIISLILTVMNVGMIKL